ncbi:class C sortase [Bifidobacterium scaligerum]|uniref:Class C sortase n=1 Tax=Bifidobacterium scaligerum TaxID=2052656 RepID=A0A2M9HQ16_9BIFI|nr:class C sortase [Bifidobacterium scaligerum]PJM78907.1 class C sortase [Bifidobacterium scaligerum]
MTFDQILSIDDDIAWQRRERRRRTLMRLAAIVCIVAAIGSVAIPLTMQMVFGITAQQTASSTARQMAALEAAQRTKALHAAESYNAELADDGQPVLGEAGDPWSTQVDDNGLIDYESALSTKDNRYQSLLNAGDGIMARIRVPKQSIDLPVYHGTSQQALAKGAGHLYGTSLPVGGTSTHAVITGHRGLVTAAMFTRLDEVRTGDYFYIDVMGETLTYQVDRISVIKPDDVTQLKVTQGEDRVTLMTCTPYRLNTHRLLVSGIRVRNQKAPQAETTADVRTAQFVGLAVGVGVLLVGWMVVLAARRKSPAMPLASHAA